MPEKTTPYIDDSGNVIIPFNSDPKYHFWKDGQQLSVTLQEMKLNEDVWKKHTGKPFPGDAA
jgi:hypothetical protein